MLGMGCPSGCNQPIKRIWPHSDERAENSGGWQGKTEVSNSKKSLYYLWAGGTRGGSSVTRLRVTWWKMERRWTRLVGAEDAATVQTRLKAQCEEEMPRLLPSSSPLASH